MTVFFDPDRQRWRYHFRHGGKRHTGYCVYPDTGAAAANKTEAKRIEAVIRAAAIAARPRPEAPACFTVAQMLAAYATRKQHGRDWVNKRAYVGELLTWFGAETPVTDITEQRVWDYIAWGRDQPVMTYIGGDRRRDPAGDQAKLYRPCKSGRTRADSTINRYLVTLGKSLRIVHKLRDGQGRPLLPELPTVPKLAEPQHLPRPITDHDLAAIIASVPAHLADGILLARLMGFRKGEIFNLTISQVDFGNAGVWLRQRGRRRTAPSSCRRIPRPLPCFSAWWRRRGNGRSSTCSHISTGGRDSADR